MESIETYRQWVLLLLSSFPGGWSEFSYNLQSKWTAFMQDLALEGNLNCDEILKIMLTKYSHFHRRSNLSSHESKSYSHLWLWCSTVSDLPNGTESAHLLCNPSSCICICCLQPSAEKPVSKPRWIINTSMGRLTLSLILNKYALLSIYFRHRATKVWGILPYQTLLIMSPFTRLHETWFDGGGDDCETWLGSNGLVWPSAKLSWKLREVGVWAA